MTSKTNECSVCYMEFDIENGKSYIGKCGHSICAACTNQPASSKCPHCNRESAFEVSRGIRQLFQKINESRYPQPFEQLESFGETELSDEIKNYLEKMYLSTLSIEEKLRKLQNLEEGFCDECGEKTPKIRICVTCAVNQKVLRRVGDQFEVIEYLDAEKAKKIFKGMVICKNCALDGSLHKDHKTVRVATMKIMSADYERNEKVRMKIEDLNDDATEVCDTLRKLSEEVKESLNEYFYLHEHLPVSERRSHFKNVRDQIEQVDETIRLVTRSSRRLEVLDEEMMAMRILFESQQI